MTTAVGNGQMVTVEAAVLTQLGDRLTALEIELRQPRTPHASPAAFVAQAESHVESLKGKGFSSVEIEQRVTKAMEFVMKLRSS